MCRPCGAITIAGLSIARLTGYLLAGRFAREALTQEQRNALFTLPATLELEGGILAVHGTPTDDSTYLTEESYDHRMIPAGRDLVRERLGEAISRKIVLCGHSHRQ
jgi:hypothetical protein